MGTESFRRIALSLPDVVEKSHFGHPDFRVNDRVFASLHYPSVEWGVVNISPEEQDSLVQSDPDVFRPVKGAWGKKGSTNVLLDKVDDSALEMALELAWKHIKSKQSKE